VRGARGERVRGGIGPRGTGLQRRATRSSACFSPPDAASPRGCRHVPAGFPFSQECLWSFEWVPDIVCEVCGRGLPGLAQKGGAPLLGPACPDSTYAFDRVRSSAVDDNQVVRAILLLKFAQIEPVGGHDLRRGSRNWCMRKEMPWRRTWRCRYLPIASGNGSVGSTRRSSSSSRWQRDFDCRTMACW
jgi:hypothetical protein